MFCTGAALQDGRALRLICSSGGDTEDSFDHCPDQTSLADRGRAAIGFRANTKIPLFILLDDFFPHYNIQPDIMSSRPCVTSCEESWDTHLKIRITESAVIIVMIGDSASEPNIIANDSGLGVYICMQMHNPAQSGYVLL